MPSFAAAIAAFTLSLVVGCGDSASYETGQDVASALTSAGIDVSSTTKVSDGGFVQQVGGESWTVDIEGNSAFINVFPNKETLDNWLGMSKSFGGIAVVGDTWAVSLDTDDGARADSAKISPKVADALGGTVQQ